MDSINNTSKSNMFTSRLGSPFQSRLANDQQPGKKAANTDRIEISTSPWRAAFAGAATTAISSASAFHMPVIRAFGALTPAGRVISAATMGATLGGMAHRIFAKENAFSDKGVTWGAAMGVGAALAGLAAVTPAFLGLSVAGQIVTWAAFAVVGGGLSALADVNPKLAISATTGGIWALTAAPNLLQPLTPALACAAAAVGGGIGALHNRLFSQNTAGTSVATTVEAKDMPKLDPQTAAYAEMTNDMQASAAH